MRFALSVLCRLVGILVACSFSPLCGASDFSILYTTGALGDVKIVARTQTLLNSLSYRKNSVSPLTRDSAAAKGQPEEEPHRAARTKAEDSAETADGSEQAGAKTENIVFKPVPPTTFLVSLGGLLYPGAMGKMDKGEMVISCYNQMGYSVGAIGALNLALGVPVLQERARYSSFPIVATNLFWKNKEFFQHQLRPSLQRRKYRWHGQKQRSLRWFGIRLHSEAVLVVCLLLIQLLRTCCSKGFTCSRIKFTQVVDGPFP